MSAEEKAKQLISNFRNEISWIEEDYPVDLYREAKECAAICVNEIIESHTDNLNGDNIKEKEYWQQVLTSINNTKQ